MQHNRRLETGAAAAARSEEQVLSSTSNGGSAARDSVALAANAAAVRNVLLAITNQPLVPGLPGVGRPLSPAAAQKSVCLSPSDNAAFGSGSSASLNYFTATPASPSPSTSKGSFRGRPVGSRPVTPEAAVSGMDTASEQHRRRGSRSGVNGSGRYIADDAAKGMGSGVLEAVGRVYRRSAAALASAVIDFPPALAGVGGEGEDGDLRQHRQEKRWQPFLSRREGGRYTYMYEEEGKQSRAVQGVGLTDGGSTSAGEEMTFDCLTQRRESRLRRGMHADGDGDGDDVGLEGPPQSRSLEDTTQPSGGAGGARSTRDATTSRRMGVDEVCMYERQHLLN